MAEVDNPDAGPDLLVATIQNTAVDIPILQLYTTIERSNIMKVLTNFTSTDKESNT
jgi:hypothetical protein